jgi:hypothetical protein
MAEKAAEDRHVEERHKPPQSRHPGDDVAIGLEPGQRASIGQHQIERLLELRVGDHRRRIGAKVAYANLLEAVEGKKPRHRAPAEAACAIIDHLHVAHPALPRGAETSEPFATDEAQMTHDHHEREIVEVHQQGELGVQEDCAGQRVRS